MTEKQLLARCRRIIKCDTARIASSVGGTKWLIIGFNRNTRDDKRSQCFRNDEPYDYPYVEECTIASGQADEELLASVREYRRLQGMTMEAYVLEQAGVKR
ncbi:MAG: hypothetical protein V2A71_06275 [Candidatus Eisenbacteria bacterium]